ncbi:MAG: hypothetical protein IPH31_05480 [Lewinellaceae bacterium]|nr:hypothetical protein [Lewinellaceae bacterium]
MINMLRRLRGLLPLLLPLPLLSQTSGIPLQSPSYPMLDRLEILSGIESPIHPELKFFNRRDAAVYALRLDSLGSKQLSWRDQRDIRYLLNDNNEWLADTSRLLRRNARRGILKYFYQTPANFYEVNTRYFKLRANPMLNFHLGRERDDAEMVFKTSADLNCAVRWTEKCFLYQFGGNAGSLSAICFPAGR